MACSGCKASIDDCPSGDAFPYTLTPLQPFPWVFGCPEGVDCSAALSVTMICCENTTTINIPAGTSAADRARLINQLIENCRFLQEGCAGGGGDDPAPPTTTTYYLSHGRTGHATCANGDVYNITIPGGMFIAASQSAADEMAQDYADTLAVRQLFCITAPSSRCKDVATTINIDASARVPVTFTLVSGSYPTGMTATQMGGRLQLSGTPTVSGAATFTIKVTDSFGGYVQKSITIYILAITTASPLPNFTPGQPYSEQLVGTGGTGSYAWSITDGSLPDGLSLSVGGLISGTPTSADSATFTVGMRDLGLTNSVTCEKEFEMESEFGGIYYELDTTAGGIAVDSFGANDTDLNDGARTLTSGPIVSAWLFNSVVPPTGNFPSSILTDKEVIDSKSITIRFWVKCLEPVTLLQAFTNFVLATRYFKISIKDGPLDGVYNKSPDSGSGFGYLCNATTDTVDDGNWHRIIFTYNEDTGEARFQVDDNTPTLETVAENLIVDGGPISNTDASDTVAFQISPYFEVIGTGYPAPYNQSGFYSGVELAEIFIGPGIVWDDVDCAYDWNSGAGRTYPDLP